MDARLHNTGSRVENKTAASPSWKLVLHTNQNTTTKRDIMSDIGFRRHRGRWNIRLKELILPSISSFRRIHSVTQQYYPYEVAPLQSSSPFILSLQKYNYSLYYSNIEEHIRL